MLKEPPRAEESPFLAYFFKYVSMALRVYGVSIAGVLIIGSAEAALGNATFLAFVFSHLAQWVIPVGWLTLMVVAQPLFRDANGNYRADISASSNWDLKVSGLALATGLTILLVYLALVGVRHFLI